MVSKRHIFLLLALFLFFNKSYAISCDNSDSKINIETLSEKGLDSILKVQKIKDSVERADLIKINETLLSNHTSDSIAVTKTLAILYSENKNSDKASEHIKKYIKDTQDLSILNDHVFSDIKGTEVYSKLTKEYKPHFNFLSLIHALTGIIGVFIVIILFAKRNLDKTSVLLIGSFILFHSFFMLHISLFMSNYNLMFPHSFYISTPFSFLYGPLLYFYFKRVVENYKISIKMLYI